MAFFVGLIVWSCAAVRKSLIAKSSQALYNFEA